MGAMRLPKRVTRLVGDEPWSLVNYLNSLAPVTSKLKLVPFVYSDPNNLFFYNGRKIFRSDMSTTTNDPLGFGQSIKGGHSGIPDAYAARAPSFWLDVALQPFAELIKAGDDQKAYKYLAKYDHHSMRSFLRSFDAVALRQEFGLANNEESLVDSDGQRLDKQYPQAVIDWLESFDAGTGVFDRSLSETVPSVLSAITFLSY